MKYQVELLKVFEADPRLVVMTAENRAPIRDIIPHLGERFIDTGITEQTMVGMSAGLALRGRIPVIHALSTFLTMRAFEFIRTDIGIPQLPVKLVGFVPGVLSEANGPTHQALEDLALMLQVPGMRVFSPGTHQELAQALPTICADPHPWYIRYNHREFDGWNPSFELGGVKSVGSNSDCALITHGALLSECLKARELLLELGIRSSLIHAPCLSPFPDKKLRELLRNTQNLFIIEDHFRRGALSSLISEMYLNESEKPKVVSFDFGAKWFQPSLLPELLHYEGFTPEAISNRVQQALKGSAR